MLWGFFLRNKFLYISRLLMYGNYVSGIALYNKMLQSTVLIYENSHKVYIDHYPLPLLYQRVGGRKDQYQARFYP